MSSRQTSNWISLSDMMTGLMLIFLLIAVLTISQVVAQENERQQMITEYDLSKEEIYSDLEEAFGGKKDEWGIEIARDLSIKFQNPDLLFDTDDSNLKDNYRQILDEFIPKYLSIVNKDEYKNRIREVRIEGHTAEVSPATPTYMSTISLSQNRANSVLAYMLENEYYLSLSEEDKAKLLFWFTANGLGKGRTLDANGEYTYESGGSISPTSRRVEFRIVTTSEELIEEIISKQKLTN
jgi:outer membrane protein OmpA-like peptidoglycan-associated protein